MSNLRFPDASVVRGGLTDEEEVHGGVLADAGPVVGADAGEVLQKEVYNRLTKLSSIDNCNERSPILL